MTTSSQPKQFQLPPLRNGITFAFNDYDKEGKPHWVIHDSGRNKFFMIGWMEYEIISRWYLRDPLAILESIKAETTLHVELSDIENFYKFLMQHYLLVLTGYQIQQQAKEQKLFKDDNILSWLITYYLYFRIPLCHPDSFLSSTKKIADFLFSKKLGILMVILAIIAIYQLNARWDEFTHTFSTIFTWQGLFFYLIAFLFCKLCHELGHAYMCKRYGIPVPTLGVAFLVFWPVLYTDTTLSWSLNNAKRMRIALAGMWMETYVTILAALVWCNIDNATLRSICYLIITVNWLASLTINVSPFMRFDGYYVLADYLKMPNLQPRAFALARWQIRRWLFGWDDPPPERYGKRMHNFLIVFAITTWLYRLMLYLGIAFLVYHFFIKIVGIILFGIEIFYFILGPILNEVKVWLYYKEKFVLNKHLVLTLLATFIAFMILFLPIHETIRLPATLSYQHQFLFAPHEGVLATSLPKIGTLVKAHQAIAKINSPDLDQELIRLQLEYQKTLAELRRSAINMAQADQKSVLYSDINRQVSEYRKLTSVQKKMILTIDFDGQVIEVDPELRPGSFVKKNEWLIDVINPNKVQIEAFVSQIDINRLKKGLLGYFYPYDLSQPAISVKVVSIEALNAKELGCHFSKDISSSHKDTQPVETPCYNSNVLGGDIATYVTDQGEYIPTESVYRVLLVATERTKPSYIQRGSVILTTQPSSFAHRFFYRVKSFWIEQSSF